MRGTRERERPELVVRTGEDGWESEGLGVLVADVDGEWILLELGDQIAELIDHHAEEEEHEEDPHQSVKSLAFRLSSLQPRTNPT